jgi:hypothetical protein
MQKINSTIYARTALILAVFGLVGVAVYARNDFSGFTFATNGIDLKIDNHAWYNGSSVPGSTWALKDLNPTSDKFFNFDDIKPGDSGRTLVSTHVEKSDAWLCLDFSNIQSNDNGVNEPEFLLDSNGSTTGELAEGTEFFSWIDNGDGIYNPGEKILFGNGIQGADDVLNEKTYTVSDASGGGLGKVNTTGYVGIMWCAGDLTVNTSTGANTCNGSVLGNEAQTDSFTVDVVIRAMPSAENPNFLCTGTTTRAIATRTQGFWQTHTAFTSKVFALPTMQKFIGVNVAPVAGTHKGKITHVNAPSSSQLFGAFYSSIPKKTNGTNRASIDKNRMQLLQQLMAAKLNCAMEACTAATLNLITSADAAYAAGSGNMLTLSNQLDTYNNSGDSISLPASLGAPGGATPSTSSGMADKVFWNTP